MSTLKPYLCISASAGSGKTFQLSYRWLRLLAMQVDPESIGGFTFSRKAAGEIFESILQALGEAASGPEGARVASDRMGILQDDQRFLSDLKRVLQVLPHLRLGTLDAHIARLLSAVSMEMGLPAEFSLQDELSPEQVAVRREIVNGLFGSHALKQEQVDLFLDMFEQATHGKTGKSFTRPVLEFIESNRTLFRNHPDRKAWEGPVLSDPPQALVPGQIREIAEEVIERLKGKEMHATARKSLLGFVEACASYSRGSVWSRELPGGKVVDQIWEGIEPAFLYHKKTIDLEGPIWDHLQTLVDHVAGIEWENARERTRGMWGFLALFEAAYRTKAFPAGQLTFEDASAVMAQVHHLSPQELAYRLDGEIDHWLLDEFQDTSRTQWKVLEPFLTEVLQDPEERRTLFLVGDVKQAIYGWRGGDAALFEQVQESWPRMETTSMATSYRSAPAILEAVNALFLDVEAEKPIPANVAERWNHAFEPHQAANKDDLGEVTVLSLEEDGPSEEEQILDYLRSLPQRCETALLVQDNKQGNAWAQFLREQGFKVSREGSSPLRGGRVIEIVLSALTMAAHPADDHSKRLVEMAGLDVDGFVLLRLAQEHGMAAAIRELRTQLGETATSPYSQNRLDLLQSEAMEYDAHHEPNVDRFLDHIDGLHVKETGGGQGIRIMTIHQSKGLGFDAVVLPIPSRSGFSVRLTGLHASPPEITPSWVTSLPPKAVCQRIPELQALRTRAEEQEIYETLCVLYVAMTRAKQSLFITLPPAGGSENTFGNWIPKRLNMNEASEEALKAHWGSPAWVETFHRPPDSRPKTSERLSLKKGKPPQQRLEPSREQASPIRVSDELRHLEHDGREIGTRVHAILEKLEFTDPPQKKVLEHMDGDLPEEVRLHVEGAWKMKELKRPEGVEELWREQKFETLLPEGWVTGVFDRVVLFKDRAWIQDYKTNRTVTEVTIEHYRPQMNLYRRVLADMLALDPEKIECHLLFTRIGQVHHV